MRESALSLNHPGKAMADIEAKYLIFSLAGEKYGIHILQVKEIIGLVPITRVPRTPSFFMGVTNLRGRLIPVIDLRLKFGMEEMAYTDRTCIIVTETTAQTDPILMGIVVDAVTEVLNIKSADVEEPPIPGAQMAKGYILGLAKTNEGVKILLDIDQVVGGIEPGSIGRTA